jgi:iron complex transport system permease protein
MVMADLIARIALAPTEIPVGAVTAAIGAPLFVYLLKKV